MPEIKEVAVATLTGMTTEQFSGRGKRMGFEGEGSPLETSLHRTHLPAHAGSYEVLRANGYKTYIVTGGGQDFVRVYAEQTYGIPPEQVVGSAGETKFGYDKAGKPVLIKVPKLMLLNDEGGKPEGIHLMIGCRPYAAFGNTAGDQQMREYTKAGDGARLAMLLLHDDAAREYAYGPAQGLPDSKVGGLHSRALRQSPEGKMDCHQHEEGLEGFLV